MTRDIAAELDVIMGPNAPFEKPEQRAGWEPKQHVGAELIRQGHYKEFLGASRGSCMLQAIELLMLRRRLKHIPDKLWGQLVRIA